jgi:hypothetical protein
MELTIVAMQLQATEVNALSTLAWSKVGHGSDDGNSGTSNSM